MNSVLIIDDDKKLCALIRQKIEDDRAVPVYIRTISNLGYQFMPNISVKKDSL